MRVEAAATSPAAGRSLDRRAVGLMAALTLSSIAANLDRFILGRAGWLQAHDLADINVTTFATCGEFWRSALRSTWNPMLRGWPLTASTFDPQTFGCLVGGMVAPQHIFPLLHTVLLIVMAVGSFLFVFLFLNDSHEVAVAGAVLNVVLYYWFHEHLVVTSATLLLPLVGFLSVTDRSLGARLLAFAGGMLVIGLSNPYLTLVLMPVAHLFLVAALPVADRRRHISRWAIFWCAYCVYYAPTIVSHLAEFPHASRSLWSPAPASSGFWTELKDRLMSPILISPAAILLCVVRPRTLRVTLLMVVTVVTIAVVSAANAALVVGTLARHYPGLLAVSTTYYRVVYLPPVFFCLWGVYLLRHNDSRRVSVHLLNRVALMVLFCAVAYLERSHTPVSSFYWRYALIIAVAIGLVPPRLWGRRPLTAFLASLLVILPCRGWYAVTDESWSQGNLFVEPSALPASRVDPFRTVTVVRTCDPTDLFPAQAAIIGQETLDGIATLYDRAFAQRWWYYVADTPGTCNSRFARMNARVEVTPENWAYAPDRVFRWLWINNVGFVRSVVPLEHTGLELVDVRPFLIKFFGEVPRYLYRLRTPVDRVFGMPEAAVIRASGDLEEEDRVLEELRTHGGVSNVHVDRVNPSRLRFSGSFSATDVIVASENYHPRWRLYVDSRPSPAPVERGPFGMIGLHPLPGPHSYELVFEPPAPWLVPLCMAAAVVLLWYVGTLPVYDLRARAI
jgi:hypothetical protein